MSKDISSSKHLELKNVLQSPMCVRDIVPANSVRRFPIWPPSPQGFCDFCVLVADASRLQWGCCWDF